MRLSRLPVGVFALLLGLFSVLTTQPIASARTTNAAAAAQHAAPRWIAASTVNASPDYQGSSVSCPTATFCMMVGVAQGSPGAGNLEQGIAEIWNGHTWSVTTPPAELGGDVSLDSVSCVSALFCVTVGTHENPTSGDGTAVIDMWDGHHWLAETTTTFPGRDELGAVSCTSTTFCMAVGDNNDNAQCLDGMTADSGEDTLAEKWDGHSWAVVDTPSFGQCGTLGDGENGYDDWLAGVSCVNSSSCVAVGHFTNADGIDPSGEQTAAATWNGTTWTAHPGLSPNGADRFYGVSCATATACLAVGYTGSSRSDEMAQEWNGSAWSIVPAPLIGTGGAFAGVSCTGPTSCVAIGTVEGTTNATLVETWTGGTTWARQSAPAVSPLGGVSCTSSTACTVVGGVETTFSGSTYTGAAFALISKGSSYQLTVLPDPNIESSYLVGTSCVGTTCFAVGGFRQDGARTYPLIERGRGRRWVNSVAATESSLGSDLTGISCVSAKSCMAVGTESALDGQRAVAQRWNGTTWSDAGAVVATSPSFLLAVSCKGARFCMAVGHRLGAAPSSTLAIAEMWNGIRWQVTPTASPGKAVNDLSGISCTAATRCIAVGSQQSTTSGPTRVLTERWNGHKWSVVKGRNPGKKLDELTGVSCPSRHGCVAVGSEAAGLRPSTLVETLLQGRWKVAKSRNVAHVSSALSSVSCLSLTRCQAVGSDGTTVSRTLAEALSGTKWSITESANSGTAADSLSGVACDTSLCSAVGLRAARVAQTVAEALSG